MARRSRPSFTKRQKEMVRQQKAQEKRAKRLEVKERQAGVEPRTSQEDPDIAGISPGPQPPPEWTDGVQRRP